MGEVGRWSLCTHFPSICINRSKAIGGHKASLGSDPLHSDYHSPDISGDIVVGGLHSSLLTIVLSAPSLPVICPSTV